MEFIVLRAGQVIHDESMVPGAVQTAVGMPAVDGVGAGEHLVLNDVQGWKVEVGNLQDLLGLVEEVRGQVTLRRPLDLYLHGRQAFALDVTPGIGS